MSAEIVIEKLQRIKRKKERRRVNTDKGRRRKQNY
jgi:hypothetical protein